MFDPKFVKISFGGIELNEIGECVVKSRELSPKEKLIAEIDAKVSEMAIKTGDYVSEHYRLVPHCDGTKNWLEIEYSPSGKFSDLSGSLGIRFHNTKTQGGSD